MRLNWSDDEDYPGQFALFQANCERSLKGRAGQRALREIEAVLAAMPDKRLWNEVFVRPSGEMCALGALAVQRKIDAGLSADEAIAVCADKDPDESQAHGEDMGLPALVAWKVVEHNDILNDEWSMIRCAGPNEWQSNPGYYIRVRTTPELRYGRVLAWVRSCISEVSR